MMPDDSQHPEDENKVVGGSTDQGGQPLYYLPFAVQLQNIFAIEIVARRFPVSLDGTSSAQLSLNLGDVQIDDENLLAQAILSVQVDFNNEPRPFEVSFKLLGHFVYTREYKAEMVHQFLEQGSLSVMLPFARELLISLCSRLQVPPIMLQMVQLAPPPNEVEKDNAPQ
jgi:preprotein translocase subunit SecB